MEKEFIDTYEHELLQLTGSKYAYYKNKWITKDNGGFNPAALIFGVFWLGYRKMYNEILITLGLFILFDIAMLFIYPNYPESLDSAIGIAAGVFFGLNGNRLFFNKLKKNIDALNELNLSSEQRAVEIHKAKGPSVGGIFIALGLVIAYGVLIGSIYSIAGVI